MKKLKEKLNAKLSKNGGFTLVEMLIVVAIIAILIAISIPLVGSALDKAEEATDAANERAFKGTLVSSYLLTKADMMESGSQEVEANTVYAYDAVNGKVVPSTGTLPKAYGKSTGLTSYILFGKVSADGEVSMKWADKADGIDFTKDSNLVSPGLIGS